MTTSVQTGSGPVVAVCGGSGGVGASHFAAALAVTAGSSVLVDLDPSAGGIDVLVGIEDLPGARWSGLQVAGGLLEPEALVGGLPRLGPCAVLAADTTTLDAAAVEQVLDTAATSGAVVVDLPRHACAVRSSALLFCDLVVVLARSDVVGLVAAHAQVASLAGNAGGSAVGTVVRRGAVRPDDAAELIGAPLLGTLDALTGRPAPFDPHRLPRSARRVAAGVLAGLHPRPASRIAPAGVA